MPRRRFRFRLLVKDEYQPLSVIPVALWLLLTFMLAAQLAFHHFSEEARADVRKFHLSAPLRREFCRPRLSVTVRRWRGC